MKTIKITLLLVCTLCLTGSAFSQNVNWGSLKPETKHLLTLNVGWDYGLVYGIGYSYQLKTKMPVLLQASYSIPSGGKLLDDFKAKIGGQVCVYNFHDFRFSASVHGIYRRYENPLVRLQNFGSEMSGIVGYYRPRWFAAGVFGFDKAIVTHFKHSDTYKEYTFAGVRDGWYEPATGGNFHYGLQTGFSMKKSELTLSLGKLITQDFKTKPFLPFYAQVGFNLKFNDGKKNQAAD